MNMLFLYKMEEIGTDLHYGHILNIMISAPLADFITCISINNVGRIVRSTIVWNILISVDMFDFKINKILCL